MTESPRRLARETAFKLVYACETSGLAPDELGDGILKEAQLEAAQERFASELVSGTWLHRQWADTQISSLATNWNIERIALLDRTILRIALFELVHRADIPPKVAINEAIELAKKYSTAESSAFINGILDRFHKQHQPG